MSRLRQFDVYGHDGGAVEVVCNQCDSTVGQGGCACCADNAATLFDLVASIRDHACPIPKDETS